MYLLDMNVVSELRKSKPHGGVVAWLHSVPDDDLAVPAVVIGEMQAGAERTRDQDVAKSDEIERFIDQILSSFSVLPLDARIFREWARLIHGKSRNLTEDALIAATARVHAMVVVTRNVKHFAMFDVRLLDPFTSPSRRQR